VPDDVDITGKTITIMGNNSGLGFEAAKYLHRMNLLMLIIGSRDGERANLQNQEETGCKTSIDIWAMNLSKYASVREFSQRLSSLERLDGLPANAGVEMMEFELAEGLEIWLTVKIVLAYLTAMASLSMLGITSQHCNFHTSLSRSGSMNRCYAPGSQLNVPEDADIFSALSDARTADMQFRYPLRS
jgi:NAD(P)-dependent dehydrogenase (short-subunit alcohol dehydrogenase family)